MARRGKTSPAEDIMDLVAMLPWWVGVVLALVSYLLLHSVAFQQVVATTQPSQVGAMVTQTLWNFPLQRLDQRLRRLQIEEKEIELGEKRRLAASSLPTPDVPLRLTSQEDG